MAYKYDVFISYSSHDRPWAEKLANELEARKLEPFLDQNKLRSGRSWEQQLLPALKESRHLLVLWSENARASDWVNREIGYFDASINGVGNDQNREGRRTFFLVLEGQPKAYTSNHMITGLKENGAYGQGIEKLDPNLWQRVVSKIYSDITDDDPSIPIPLAILTTTQARLNQLDWKSKPNEFSETLDAVRKRIGIKTKSELLQYYGQERTDWRPFGSVYNINTLLDKLKNDINNALGSSRFRWEPLSDDFWSNDVDAVQRAADKLASEVSVVVIDPLALYDQAVRDRLEFLDRCLRSDKAVIMTLTPFAMPSPTMETRSLIQKLARPVFRHVYEPDLSGNGLCAKCSINIGDEMDIKRLLLTTLAAHVLNARPRPEQLRTRT